jgi:hypothetical protein
MFSANASAFANAPSGDRADDVPEVAAQLLLKGHGAIVSKRLS